MFLTPLPMSFYKYKSGFISDVTTSTNSNNNNNKKNNLRRERKHVEYEFLKFDSIY